MVANHALGGLNCKILQSQPVAVHIATETKTVVKIPLRRRGEKKFQRKSRGLRGSRLTDPALSSPIDLNAFPLGRGGTTKTESGSQNNECSNSEKTNEAPLRCRSTAALTL